MSDKAEMYRACQDRVAALVRDLDEAELSTRIASCPGWTVTDLLAHLSGTAHDFRTGNMAGAPGREWTDAQVSARAGRSAAELLDEWLGSADEHAAMLATVPPGLAGIAVMDAVTHEHDLRETLGRTDEPDAESLAFCLKGYVNSLGGRIGEAGLRALTVEPTDGPARTAGIGEPGATVRGSAYELTRALAGRRTTTQARDLDWSADPEPYLSILSPFGPLPD